MGYSLGRLLGYDVGWRGSISEVSNCWVRAVTQGRGVGWHWGMDWARDWARSDRGHRCYGVGCREQGGCFGEKLPTCYNLCWWCDRWWSLVA